MLPVVGQLWWLFLFLVKDKSNEHQLCEFIIGFKAAQFVTLGIVATTLGVLRYVRCTMQDMRLCMLGTFLFVVCTACK